MDMLPALSTDDLDVLSANIEGIFIFKPDHEVLTTKLWLHPNSDLALQPKSSNLATTLEVAPYIDNLAVVPRPPGISTRPIRILITYLRYAATSKEQIRQEKSLELSP
jgi:hypothetical protein